MTDQEFQEFGVYLTGLWPKFTMTPEQRELWRQKFEKVPLFDAREAAARAYGGSKFPTPRPGDVFDALRKVRQERTRGNNTDFHPDFVAQVQREEAEEAAAIADWTDQQREDGRQEIIRRESGMAHLIGKCPLHGPMLTHFLVERFIHHRATVFPQGRPVQVSTEEYWGKGTA